MVAGAKAVPQRLVAMGEDMRHLAKEKLHLPVIITAKLKAIVLVVPAGGATGQLDVVATLRLPQLEVEVIQVRAFVDILIHAIAGVLFVRITANITEFQLAGIFPATRRFTN